MIALLGILSILALAALCSDNRRRIRCEQWALPLCLQVLFAALVLWLPAGQQVLNGVSESVSSVIGYGQEDCLPCSGIWPEVPAGLHLRLQRAAGDHLLLRADRHPLSHRPDAQSDRPARRRPAEIAGHRRAENLSATANIFVGMVKRRWWSNPISRMSDSQFFAVMSCGLASVAGGTWWATPASGRLKYLIAAAFMSAPAGLAMAKILVPPAAQEEDHHEDVEIPRATNVIEAAASGAWRVSTSPSPWGRPCWPSSA